MSASSKKMWTRFVKRGNLTGSGGGERRSRSDSSAVFLLRLRRLEKVVLTLSGVRILTRDAMERILTLIEESDNVVGTSAGSSD